MTKSLCAVGLLLVLPILGGCGGGGGGNGDDAPPIDLGVFPSASFVIGQPSFFTEDANQGGVAPAANTLNTGSKSPVDGSLYICDEFNNRILGYTTLPAFNNANADFVIGQADFVSDTTGTSATQLNTPAAIGSDGTRLAVADRNNDRVLLWSTLPTGNVAATTVVGQADFVSNGSGTTATTMDSPADVHLAGGRLFVVDKTNNRVLIWNTIPTTNGVAADVVLGQADFTSNGVGTTASTLDAPQGIWSDGTRVAVADTGNHRILIWNTIPVANGAPADVVLGQPDFTSNTSVVGPAGLQSPRDMNSNGTQLFIADSGHHRVVIHDTFPATNNRPADQVVGQSDFVHVTRNDDDQNGVNDGVPSARTLGLPTGVLALGARLVIADSDNSRVLIYTP